MKKRNFSSRLNVKKITVSVLNSNQMHVVGGGARQVASDRLCGNSKGYPVCDTVVPIDPIDPIDPSNTKVNCCTYVNC